MSRKTINVAKMLYWANFQLARQDEIADQAYKQGVCDMIEHILFATGNYRGFGYHTNEGYEPTKDNYQYFSRYYFVSDKIRENYRFEKRLGHPR